MKRACFVLLLTAGLSMPGGVVSAQRPAGDAATFAAYAGTGYRVVPNITYTTASGVELKLDFTGRPRQRARCQPRSSCTAAATASARARKPPR